MGPGPVQWSRGRCDGAGAGAMGPRRSGPVSGGSAAPGGGSLATAPWQRREPRGCARRAGGSGGPRGHPGAGRDPPTPSEPRARERNSNRALPSPHFSSGSGAPAVPPGTRVPGKLRQPCPMHCVAGRAMAVAWETKSMGPQTQVALGDDTPGTPTSKCSSPWPHGWIHTRVSTHAPHTRTHTLSSSFQPC